MEPQSEWDVIDYQGLAMLILVLILIAATVAKLLGCSI